VTENHFSPVIAYHRTSGGEAGVSADMSWSLVVPLGRRKTVAAKISLGWTKQIIIPFHIGRSKIWRMDKKDEEQRMDSFLNLLIGIDSGAMVFFLWFVRGDRLGVGHLPFQLAFMPFKYNVLTLAACAASILIIRGLNLYCHGKPRFQKNCKRAAWIILTATIIAVCDGGCTLIENPNFLSDSKK
jgi:hypothetical protein